MPKGIFLPNDLLDSPAFISLSPLAIKVLILFKRREQREKVGIGKHATWRTKNNGEIRFSYKEAEDNFGINRHSFKRVLDELESKGFIEKCFWGGLLHQFSLYSVSDKWKSTPSHGNYYRGAKTALDKSQKCAE